MNPFVEGTDRLMGEGWIHGGKRRKIISAALMGVKVQQMGDGAHEGEEAKMCGRKKNDGWRDEGMDGWKWKGEEGECFSDST